MVGSASGPGVEHVDAGGEVGVALGDRDRDGRVVAVPVEVAPGAGGDPPGVAVAEQVARVVAVDAGLVGAAEEQVGPVGEREAVGVEAPHRGVAGGEGSGAGAGRGEQHVVALAVRRAVGVGDQAQVAQADLPEAAGPHVRDGPGGGGFDAGEPRLVVGVDPVGEVDAAAGLPSAVLVRQHHQVAAGEEERDALHRVVRAAVPSAAVRGRRAAGRHLEVQPAVVVHPEQGDVVAGQRELDPTRAGDQGLDREVGGDRSLEIGAGQHQGKRSGPVDDLETGQHPARVLRGIIARVRASRMWWMAPVVLALAVSGAAPSGSAPRPKPRPWSRPTRSVRR